jgi:hypothetical protein
MDSGIRQATGALPFEKVPYFALGCPWERSATGEGGSPPKLQLHAMQRRQGVRKFLELTSADSCINKAKPDEWVFVLLGRDLSAPVAIRAWIADRIKSGKNLLEDAQIVEAERCAAAMDAERGTW